MITLSPGSLCDVCAEEYGAHNLPHSIPCGHVLCLNCCNNIIKKTPSRLTPACPFCRVQFSSDAIRLIRIDFGSGWSTPKKTTIEAHDHIDIGEDDVLLFNPGTVKTRAEARRLESKVAKVAAKKCSVEEVTTLHRELQEWLNSDKLDEQTSSLQLSAALLRAILVNHVAHSEATRMAKNVEANLRERLEDAQNDKEKLEAELRSIRSQYSQKAQEAQTLRAELNRSKVKSAAPSLGVPATPPPSSVPSGMISPPRPPSTMSGSRSGATSPTSPTRTSYTPSFQSPLARPALPMHSRTTSMHVSAHRSMTPSVRSGTPLVSGADIARPATIPPKPRRMSMSTPTPTKMMRSSSSSDEKEKERQRADDKQREKDERRVQLIQRWIPSTDAFSRSPPTGRPEKFESALASATSRSVHPSMVPSRYKTPLSTHSP
ncbi:hypothetical protein VTO73DRAFT_3864 [Trametes versicolor]